MVSREDLISVIVPVLNESLTLRELYERTRCSLADRGPFEFIAVDDGSTDGTLEELKALRAEYGNISILSHYCNHGKSLALMQAFALARGEVAVIMDADLQDQPEMIPRFLDKIDEGFDVVNGWRTERQDKRARKFVSRIFNLLTSWIFKCPIHDINCGFKVIRRRVYRRLTLRGDLHRLIPAIAASQGFKVAEVPVTHSQRRFGCSRYGLLRHRGLLDIIALVASNATQLRPFHIFCEAAIICWALALAALVGGIGLSAYAPAESFGYRVVMLLVGLFGVGAALLGLLLPLFGFQLEITTGRLQDAGWRDRLLKEKLEGEIGEHGPCTVTKTVSQVRGLAALSQPDLQSVSMFEGATTG